METTLTRSKLYLQIFLPVLILLSIIPTYQHIGAPTIAPSDYKLSNELLLTNTVPDLKGWPQKTDGVIESSPILSDIDNDGTIEIIIGSSDGKVYIFHSNGTRAKGW